MSIILYTHCKLFQNQPNISIPYYTSHASNNLHFCILLRALYLNLKPGTLSFARVDINCYALYIT